MQRRQKGQKRNKKKTSIEIKHCLMTGKVKLSLFQAKLTLSDNNSSPNPTRPFRYYFCDHCESYHMTSQNRRPIIYRMNGLKSLTEMFS